MRIDVEKYIGNVRSGRKLRHRVTAFLTAMSMAVSMAVFWQLRGVGTAMEDTQVCAQQEHSHTDKCCERVLVCGQDTDGGHEHRDECYESRLICGLEEHTHSEGCKPDEGADVENEKIWEATLPKELAGDVRENVALVAASQLGYSESQRNFHFSDDAKTKNAYSRYGQWYGSPYSRWNSLFTYFCMYYAGVDKQCVPYGSGIAAWTAELEKKELLNSLGDSKPQRGDILFIDTDLDEKVDRSAVVCEVTEKDGKATAETIEGDVEGKVAKGSYQLTDKHITGFVSLENADGSLSFEQTSKSGIKVKAKAAKGVFPNKTTMTVTDISKTDAIKTAQQGIGSAEKVIDAVAVDITFKDAEGREIEPADSKNVKVQISLPQSKKLEGEQHKLLHKIDSGKVEAVENAEMTETEASFTAESFSMYIMTSTGKTEINTATRIQLGKADDPDVNNSETNRYVVNVGEVIDVYADVDNTSQGFYVSNNTIGGDENAKIIERYNGTWNEFTQKDSGYEQSAHYVARRVGNCEIVCPGHETLYLTVKPSLIYLSTVQGELPNNGETYNLLNGYGGPPWWPYHYYVGDVITVTAFVDPSNSTESFRLRHNDEGVLTELTNGVAGERNGLATVSATYLVNKASGEDRPSIYFGNSDQSDWLIVDALYPLYVKSSLGDKNIDMVDEWLSGMGLPKQNGYIPNSKSYPYVMHAGDTIELYGYNEAANVVFTSSAIETTDTVVEQVGEQTNTQSGGKYKTTVKYEAKTPGLVKVDFGNKRTAYIRVIDNDTEGKYTHADIEISDGGKYSHTTVEYQGGKKVATVKVYDSYITAVNRCILYDKDGKVIVPTLDNGDPTGDGNDVSFVPDDYYQNGQPGQPQYELTSQYKIVNGKHKESVKRYKGSDVDTALFDVKLTLKPSYQFTITTEGGVETASEPVPLTGDDEIIDNSLFYMNHQDVVDASNKCPNHTGLDFTIRSSMALTQVKAVKSLKGGSLNGNDFEFEIVDGSGTTVATALNASNGEIKFDNLHFDKAGTFNYVLKEVIPEQVDNIEYDPRKYTLNITVRDIGNGVMSAELDVQENKNYEFENTVREYTLPNTGGGGVVPYVSTGVGLMTAALLLLVWKKRKEPV